MSIQDQYERELREALGHLFDPTYQPSSALYAITGCDRSDGLDAIKSVIFMAIDGLKPMVGEPPQARSRRLYDVLLYRYIEQLTQKETAERLGITPRHLRREQREAIRLLTERILEHSRTVRRVSGEPEQLSEREADDASEDMQPPAWHHQLREEVRSLRQRTSGSVADMKEAITSAVEVTGVLASKRGIVLQVSQLPDGLTAALHPSALRQILVASISELVRLMSDGCIALFVTEYKDHITITLHASPLTLEGWPSDGDTEELVAALGGRIACQADGGLTMLHIDLPSVSRVEVLVVDDNADLAHFYRRYVHSTRYHLSVVPEGRRVFEFIESQKPDLIVLDVILPDVDGWELLTHLHDHPTSRGIPIVVCSIVREEELALALGAIGYIPKPVGRSAFLRALDEALARVATRARIALGNNASDESLIVPHS